MRITGWEFCLVIIYFILINMNFRNFIAKNYVNFRGWSTKRHLLMIESDDWGAIRMPSKSVYDALRSQGVGEGSFFDKYDSLESSEDLELLFEVLSSVKDNQGHPVVMEPFAVVANPNYEAIEKNGFSEYEYETFVDTYRRFNHTMTAFETIKEGMHSKVWCPQSHGREHIQVNRWMKVLNGDYKLGKLGFETQSFHSDCKPKGMDYNKAFDYDSIEELDQLKAILKDGLTLFENIYGYKSISFCQPTGCIGKDLLDYASKNGIKLIGGQYHYPLGGGKYKLVNLKWGEKTYEGARIYRRNCKFEPARDHNIDWVDRCLAEIKIAFRWGKPAVIDSHRVNYIGSIYPENRDYTLKEMKRLLLEIVKHWPDVKFVNSNELFNEMTQ